ncbi:MAG: LacI family DNA-binding transcriptional regulator [Phycisphaerales bacterium]|nr:LacI family DNA-binding transcriptional regulator [Phycisphaerales bacterium]
MGVGSIKSTVSRVTCIDIAKMAGVAPSTVSRVINDSTRVAPETRKRVMKAIHATGYRPSQAASALPRRRHDTIGLVSEMVTMGNHGPELIRGISVALTDSGHRLTMNMVPERMAAETLENLPLFQSVSVDGIIIDACNMIGDIDSVVGRLRIPVVFVNAPRPRPSNTVMPDDELVARHATEYLIERGHRRIGYLPGCKVTHSSHALRMNGYTQALMAHGLTPLPMWDVELDYRPELYAQRISILKSHGVTAVVTYNGIGGALAVRGAIETNLRVPQDLSIVACDFDPVAQFAFVPVTCIKLDRAQMGKLAVEMLVERIETKSQDITSIFLTGEMVELDSVRSL